MVYCYLQNRGRLSEFQLVVDNVSQFKGLEHRIELVRKINNVLFYNDSKATNVQSTEVAIKCFKNIVLLVGGVPKEDGIDYFFDKDYFTDRVIYVVCYGQCGGDFYSKLTQYGKVKCYLDQDLKSALNTAVKYSKSCVTTNDLSILLSPCCASFDQFKNFEDRGSKFKDYVKEISEW